MIIVKIRGGLGNQLFQYAMGLSLSIVKHTKLKLDLRAIKNNTFRPFRLQYFNIPFEEAREAEIEEIAQNQPATLSQKISIFAQGRFPYYRHRVINEKNHCFDANIFLAQENCYLNGYWQSEKYFNNARSLLLDQLSLKEPMDHASELIRAEIVTTQSISIHIRRGDYISVQENANHIGNLSMEYYNKAIELLSRRVEHPHFFIFSDDLEWVKANLKIHHPTTFVEHTSSIENVEMFLMSQCEHHIIANSSFSWWAAWLGQWTAKTVVAPARWFIDPALNSTDICPSQWIKI